MFKKTKKAVKSSSPMGGKRREAASSMTMGELDKMRAKKGMGAAIPRQAMVEDENKEV
jgi:hypothetical protein